MSGKSFWQPGRESWWQPGPASDPLLAQRHILPPAPCQATQRACCWPQQPGASAGANIGPTPAAALAQSRGPAGPGCMLWPAVSALLRLDHQAIAQKYALAGPGPIILWPPSSHSTGPEAPPALSRRHQTNLFLAPGLANSQVPRLEQILALHQQWPSPQPSDQEKALLLGQETIPG